MEKEKSCGCIVIDNNKVLLVKHNAGHWDFPKGHVEKNETEEQTALREVKEETNLDVIKSIYLNKIFNYKSLGYECVEYVYLSKVENNNIILNEEHIDYKWCSFNEFVDLIYWFESKENLILLLKDINF